MRFDSRYAALAAGTAALIVYGSLFPFQFGCAGSARILLSTSWRPSDRGDLLSNVLLYLPLGFFAVLAARTRAAIVPVFCGGAALSFAIETAQACDAGRVASLSDVAANALGTLAGAAMARFAAPSFGFAQLLLACWLGARLLPYLPSLSFEKYWRALRPLASPHFSALDVFHSFALWIGAAEVLAAIYGVKRGRTLLPILIACVIAARVVIVDLALSADDAAGAALAAALWIAALSRIKNRAPLAAAIFSAFIIVDALRPFQFLAAPRHFQWIPFYGLMQTPREIATRVFLEKSFMYGGLVWLLARAGGGWALASVSAAALVFVLRLAQTYLPGRSAEITDAVMVLMFAAAMKLMEEKSAATNGLEFTRMA